MTGTDRGLRVFEASPSRHKKRGRAGAVVGRWSRKHSFLVLSFDDERCIA
jgi:hypothetical protein